MIPLTEANNTTYFDKNGSIKNLFFAPVNQVAIIESKKGAVRSNHWHKVGWHWLYLISGKMEYFERDLDGSNSITKTIGPGEMVFTGPNKVHKTVFLEDTVMLNFTGHKTREEHEADIVKEEF